MAAMTAAAAPDRLPGTADTSPAAPGPDTAVRAGSCPLCATPAGSPCSASPAGDHLARWLDAYRANRITRNDLKTTISGLIVITAAQLITAQTRPQPS